MCHYGRCAFDRKLKHGRCGCPNEVVPKDRVDVGGLWVLGARIFLPLKAAMVRIVELDDQSVDGFALLLDTDEDTPTSIGEAINIGTGKETSIGDLAGYILRAVGVDKPVVAADERVRPEGSEVGQLLADISKAKNLLDWTPQIDLEEGLALTIDWIRNNLESYRTDAYVV